MPEFHFAWRTQRDDLPEVISDDAADVSQLAARILDARRDGQFLIVKETVTEQDVAEAKKEAYEEGLTPEEMATDLPKVGDVIIGGAFDPNDILHVIPLDEDGQLVVEGTEKPAQKKVDIKAISGGSKKR